MKSLMLSTAILAASVYAAAAQEATTPPATTTAETSTPAMTEGSMFREAPDAMEIRASEFIGMRIYSSESAVDADAYAGVQEGWEDIGEVNDVILSRTGTVDAVLVDIGGFLGMGERTVAVDMDALRMVSDDATADAPDDFFLVMNAARADLESAPEYVDPADQAAADGTMTDTTAPAATDTAAAPAATDTMAPAATDTAAAPVDGTATTGMTREGYMAADMATLTADRLEGATVYDSNDVAIGDVSALVLSDQGQVTQAVVDVGGFLGIGAKPVSLTLEQMQILQQDGGDDIRVYVPMTKEQLEGLPTYEG